MDPNEALKNLRHDMMIVGGNITAEIETDPNVIGAWEAWEALDEWLSRSGFLPRDWERNRH